MAKVNITTITNQIEANLAGMVNRTEALPGFLKRDTYRRYQKAQLERWQTEGASEGKKWAPLNAKYAAWKRRRYGAGASYQFHHSLKASANMRHVWGPFPGNGTKMLIATGTLVAAVVGPVKGLKSFPMKSSAENHRMIASKKGIEVGWTVYYANDVNEKRNFENFSPKTEKEMVDAVFAFLMENQG